MASAAKFRWRLYADSNVPREIIEHLRAQEFDVLWIAEDEKLRRERDDKFHYHEARKRGRILLTCDADFWNDRKFPLKDSPGVLILDTPERSVMKYLPQLLRKMTREYLGSRTPVDLCETKIRLSAECITHKLIDDETHKPGTESYAW